MVGSVGNILSPAISKQLVALQNTARKIDASQLKLATGKRVTSALDNATSFFASFGLKNQASDFNRLLDGLSQSVRTIQETDNALRALESIVRLAEAQSQESLIDLTQLSNERGEVSELILADNPFLYYQLSEVNGDVVALNQGSAGAIMNGAYQGGTRQNQDNLVFSETSRAAGFDGVNDYITIPNNSQFNSGPAEYPERTVELFFNADNAEGGRQVLFESGGGTNGISIYIDSGLLYVSARDNGDYGPFNINAPIQSGETYHVSLTLDAPNGTFTGYLNGEVIGTDVVTKPLAVHGGASALGRNQGGASFHDGPGPTGTSHFEGRISEFAVYNDVLSQEQIKARYDAALTQEVKAAEAAVKEILDQINALIEDSSFRGVNLLQAGELVTDFNVSQSSKLITKGVDFSKEKADLDTLNFNGARYINSDIGKINSFIKDIREFSSSIATDLSVIETRENFTRKTINTLESGSDDLVLADQNQVGAELLASQVRQAVQVNTLSFAANQQNSIVNLLFS